MSNEKIKLIQTLDVSQAPPNQITRYWLHLVDDGMGRPVRIPILVAKGAKDGPVLGLTAAIHGNELNGIPVVQRVFSELDTEKLHGVIVGAPVINAPAFLRKQRKFIDGRDLNHIMPGREKGNLAQVYSWRIVHRLIRQFDYLVDLHTASNGRVNSYYIRADMEDPVVKDMALLQNAQIIVHNPPNDGTLRGTADEMGIPAITLEVGDPNLFQRGMIRDSLTGIHNLLGHLKMTDSYVEVLAEETVICSSSYWIYTDMGGLLTVIPNVTDMVQKNETIAILWNLFGEILKEYKAPEDGIVIGKSVSPVNQTGGRILHLGIVDKS